MTQYVIYEGDEVVAVGTKNECAELLGVKPETIGFYATPSGRRRSKDRVVVEVRDSGMAAGRRKD